MHMTVQPDPKLFRIDRSVAEDFEPYRNFDDRSKRHSAKLLPLEIGTVVRCDM
jgi:hypothetical protein